MADMAVCSIIISNGNIDKITSSVASKVVLIALDILMRDIFTAARLTHGHHIKDS